jgi:hypothetical protein
VTLRVRSRVADDRIFDDRGARPERASLQRVYAKTIRAERMAASVFGMESRGIVPSCLAAEGAGPPPVIPVSPTRSWAAWWNLVLSLPWARVADRPVE